MLPNGVSSFLSPFYDEDPDKWKDKDQDKAQEDKTYTQECFSGAAEKVVERERR